jgi:hypothetical protein
MKTKNARLSLLPTHSATCLRRPCRLLLSLVEGRAGQEEEVEVELAVPVDDEQGEQSKVPPLAETDPTVVPLPELRLPSSTPKVEGPSIDVQPTLLPEPQPKASSPLRTRSTTLPGSSSKEQLSLQTPLEHPTPMLPSPSLSLSLVEWGQGSRQAMRLKVAYDHDAIPLDEADDINNRQTTCSQTNSTRARHAPPPASSVGSSRPSTPALCSSPLANSPVSGSDEEDFKGEKPLSLKPRPASLIAPFGQWDGVAKSPSPPPSVPIRGQSPALALD